MNSTNNQFTDESRAEGGSQFKSKLKNDSAIIFDLDGTLVDSQSSIMISIQRVLSKYLDRNISMDEVIQKYHPDWKILIAKFGVCVKTNTLNELTSMWIAESENSSSEIKPFVFSHKLLQALSCNHDLYLWTGRDRASTELILRKWHFEQYFINISCGDDNIGTKPSIKSFSALVQNKVYQKKVMIGDSLLDLHGAQQIKMPFLAVTWCHSCDKEKLRLAGVKNFINTPEELLKKLERKPIVEETLFSLDT